MSDFFGSVWWLIVSLGVLVTFHEFGHYWVARRCGVKVLRFSVGFGKPLWTRRGKDGTEYVIAAIPLGGYVKMLDEREGDVAAGRTRIARSTASRCGSASRSSPPGPLANLLLCVLLLWGMFVIGRPDFAPVVGRADGIAAQPGLQQGDDVLRVGDRDDPDLERGAARAAAGRAGPRATWPIAGAQRRRRRRATRTLRPVASLPGGVRRTPAPARSSA